LDHSENKRRKRGSELKGIGLPSASQTQKLDGLRNEEALNSETVPAARNLKSVKNQNHTQLSASQRSIKSVGKQALDADDGGAPENHGSFSTVASRIALITKRQGDSRLSSQDQGLKKQALINAYAKTSSGLRTGSFR